jgi:diguanylate cyclase (GGDEF)-like protein
LLLAGLLWLRRSLLRRERHARVDRLTGLLNRRALYEDAARLLAAATPERPAALLLVDLSEFKTINDTLGHAAGDQLLTQVATRLRALVRPEDQVFRLGGDEFAILLRDLPDRSAGQLRGEHLLAGLRRTAFSVREMGMSVDASIGVALAPAHGRGIEELLQHADVAMYEAKGGHRGTTLYDPETDRHSVGQLGLIAELRQALDNQEFVLHYQPKISLPDRHVYGVEALVRWAHPTRGLLPPGEFLPLMENSGLMQSLSEWVVREATQQAASWRRAGMPLKVAINLSSRSMLNPALPSKILATLVGADLPASFLELEITETAIMTDSKRAAGIVGQLRARGVEVSIDDFGTGYTSLALLRRLPVSAVKIDRSLITHTLDSPQDQAVIRAITDLGHGLGLRVIAEGVESGPLLDRLIELGCDRAQGYFISRPLPPGALEGWLTSWQAASAGPSAAGPATAQASLPAPTHH